MNDSLSSQSKSSYESIETVTLDEVYKDQLRALRDLIMRQCHNYDLGLCRRWLKIFSQASHAEKFARNCLCALMKSQLEEHGRLGKPFTEVENLNHDLEWVVYQLDIDSFKSNSDEPQNCSEQYSFQRPYNALTKQTSKKNEPRRSCPMSIYSKPKYVHVFSEKFDKATQYETIVPENKFKLANQFENNGILRENSEIFDLPRNNKQSPNTWHEALCTSCKSKDLKSEVMPDTEPLQCNGAKLANAIDKTMHLLEKDGIEDINSMRLFENICENYPDGDASLTKKFQACDRKLQVILQKMLEKDMEEKLLVMKALTKKRIAKKEKKMRETYDRRLRITNWAQQLQFKLLKLKCFSIMRKIFINAPHKTTESLVSGLKELEEKYQNVMDEIL